MRRPYLGEPMRKVVKWKGRTFVYQGSYKTQRDLMLDFLEKVCDYLSTP
jgi:hypothetical protein